MQQDVQLSTISSWRIGGPADVLVRPGSIDEAERTIQFLASQRIPWLVIGQTTNLLFADEGIRGVIVQFGNAISRISINPSPAFPPAAIPTRRASEGGSPHISLPGKGAGDYNVEVEAGAWVPRFAVAVGRAGLTGAEHTVGIPGTIGGLICMNGGSMRRGIGEHLVSATCLSKTGQKFELTQTDCHFEYRTSRIQTDKLIVLSARFRFSAGDLKQIKSLMRRILRERRLKFPRKLPNCGSVFVSDPAMYAQYGPPGAVIEKCGLKGKAIGGAQISPLHANFIINTGNATASDVLRLIADIRSTARTSLGCQLRCEVRYLDAHGNLYPAHNAVHQKCKRSTQ